MNESKRTFGDRLVAIETPNPEFRLKYERQVRAMLESQLSPVKRIGFALLALVGVWGIVHYGGITFSPQSTSMDVDLIVRMFMLPAFLASVAWTILTGWAAIRGSSPKSQRPWLAGTALTMVFFYLMHLTFVFVVPVAFAHEESRAILGFQFAFMTFFMLDTIGLCVILAAMHRTRLDNQEKLLEIEYHLADLSEQISRLGSKETKE
jgi:hypothetical protein